MGKVRHVTAEEHAEVTAAVGKAEQSTDGEIVTIVAGQSDDYRETPVILAVAALFAYLAAIAIFPQFFMNLLTVLSGGWEHEYRPAEYQTIILLSGAAIYVLAYLLFAWTPLRIALTAKSKREARVRQRAIELFKVGAERRTMGLTGILIYLSMAEHRAEIVADDAIVGKVSSDVWGEAMAALILEVKQGKAGAGMVAAVEQVGKVLAEHFPKSDGNPNELPDRLIEL